MKSSTSSRPSFAPPPSRPPTPSANATAASPAAAARSLILSDLIGSRPPQRNQTMFSASSRPRSLELVLILEEALLIAGAPSQLLEPASLPAIPKAGAAAAAVIAAAVPNECHKAALIDVNDSTKADTTANVATATAVSASNDKASKGSSGGVGGGGPTSTEKNEP